MTNIFKTPEKKEHRDILFEAAEATLVRDGYEVERVLRSGKPSVRRISKDGVSKLVSIRTSQDTWIAFPRNRANNGWATLEEVDYVIAASINDPIKRQFANVHMIPADEMRQRFDRAYEARKNAKYKMNPKRGMWVSLYFPEANDPVTHVGAGVGLKYLPIAQVPLDGAAGSQSEMNVPRVKALNEAEPPLTIAEAKRRLAQSLGVDISKISISINA